MNFTDKITELKCPTNLPLSGVLPPVKRIIVIGDVHGDIDQFKKTLQLAKIIDTQDNWIGKDTILVQLGDLIDSCRGQDCFINSPEDKGADFELLKFLIDLNEKAMEDDGAVYSLVGNHEIMNVQGNFNYVSPKNFDSFLNLFQNKNKLTPYQARKEAFKPGNPIADFLSCSKLGVLIIGSNLFVHAGMVPEIAKEYSPKKINEILRLWLKNELKNPEEYQKILFSSKYSPFWVRVLGKMESELPENNELCVKKVNPILNHWKVSSIHVGHSPQFIQKLGINQTCDNSVWRHDIGMSHTFSNFDKNGRGDVRQAQVLEILNDNQFNIIK